MIVIGKKIFQLKNQRKKFYLNAKDVNRLKDPIDIDWEVPAQMLEHLGEEMSNEPIIMKETKVMKIQIILAAQ